MVIGDRPTPQHLLLVRELMWAVCLCSCSFLCVPSFDLKNARFLARSFGLLLMSFTTKASSTCFALSCVSALRCSFSSSRETTFKGGEEECVGGVIGKIEPRPTPEVAECCGVIHVHCLLCVGEGAKSPTLDGVRVADLHRVVAQ